MSAGAASSWLTRSTHSASAVDGREALDIGASTGGFTDVLLKRGARRVVAFDVGHGQLDWGLRNDPRVVVIERANARALEPAHLPAPVDIVTIDVSFISLRHIFPRVPPLLADGADVVALVKPQFEAGRAEVGKKGVIRDPVVQARVVEEASRAAAEVGLVRAAMTESPITGDTGNREFFLHSQGPSVMRCCRRRGEGTPRPRREPSRADRVVAGRTAPDARLRSGHRGPGRHLQGRPRNSTSSTRTSFRATST